MLRVRISDTDLAGAVWPVIVNLANNNGFVDIVDVHINTNEGTVFTAA
jgi:hypothetical protein